KIKSFSTPAHCQNKPRTPPMAKQKAGEETFSFASDDTPPIKQPQKPLPEQLLLDFLQKWRQPTIRLNQILVYGPRPRKREIPIRPAKKLPGHIWLSPTKPRRPDMLEWRIVRHHPIVHPTIAA